MSVLFDSDSEINGMHIIFAEKLGLVVQLTNFSMQKINATTFETYGMVVAAFTIIDQANIIKFFKKLF